MQNASATVWQYPGGVARAERKLQLLPSSARPRQPGQRLLWAILGRDSPPLLPLATCTYVLTLAFFFFIRTPRPLSFPLRSAAPYRAEATRAAGRAQLREWPRQLI